MLEPEKIDFITTSADGDEVFLYIVKADPWTGAEDELRALQEKIYTYADYATGGQLAAEFPQLASLPWSIVIDSRDGPPDARTERLLELLGGAVREDGGGLRAAGAES